MKRAGTDAHYIGLYAVPQALARPAAQELDRLAVDFSEVVKVPDLAQIMVEIDTRWDHMKMIRAAKWKTPPKHADLDPPHEALQLLEQYREAGRLKKGSDEMRDWFAAAQGEADELVRALRGNDGPAADKAFRNIGTSCVRCHAKYRDVPHDRE